MGVPFTITLYNTLPPPGGTLSSFLHLSLQPLRGGLSPWLVLTHSPADRKPTPSSALSLLTSSGENPHTLLPLGPLSLHHECSPGHSRSHYFVSNRLLRPLWDKLGNPWTRALWLAARLQSRLLPGAVRTTPSHLEVWTKL